MWGVTGAESPAVKNPRIGTSLAVEWLGLRLPVWGRGWGGWRAAGRVQSLVGKLGSHMPRGQKAKT